MWRYVCVLLTFALLGVRASAQEGHPVNEAVSKASVPGNLLGVWEITEQASAEKAETYNSLVYAANDRRPSSIPARR